MSVFKKLNPLRILSAVLLFSLFFITLNSCKINSRDANNNIDEKIDADFLEEEAFSGTPGATPVSTLKISGQAIDVDVSGNYSYLTNDLGYLYVIDIKSKNNPVITGICREVDSANIVIVRGDYAYISYTKIVFNDDNNFSSECGFYIVDINDKENPLTVGRYTADDKHKKSAYGLFIEGDYAYMVTTSEDEKKNSGSLEIVDISIKENPELAGKYDVDGLPVNLWVNDNVAFLNVNYYDYDKQEYTGESKILAVNLNDKENPELSGSCNVPSNSWGMHVTGDYAFVSSWKWDINTEKYNDSIFQIVDIKNPSSLELLGKCKVPGGAWEMDSVSNYIYVSGLSGGVYIIDISDKENPVIINNLGIGDSAYDITIKGNYCYIAGGFEGMEIIKLSGQSGVTEENKFYTVNELDINLPPVPVIEVSGDTFEGEYFQVRNPVYFSAVKTTDTDGDNLSYSWMIDNDECSKEESFYYYFNEPGEYEVKLAVSDGTESVETLETIMIAGINVPITSSIKHNFEVEVEYNLINMSAKNLNDIECFMRIPQTYYPFQIINNYVPNYSGTGELLDNNWNLLLHFKFEDSLAKNESLAASTIIEITSYEFKYENIRGSDLSYDKEEEDFKKYTNDDLFIDSNSPEIRRATESLTANETDPVKEAEIIYNFVTGTLSYDYERAREEDYQFFYASEILKRRTGVCSDYAILFTALLRASGIPSRLVAGIPVYTTLYEKENEINMGHAWVEIKFPGYGWIPVDITPEAKFMYPNYYLNIATEKGSGYLYESKTMDPGSYYYDGFLFSWDGDEMPLTEQKFNFRVRELNVKDIRLD
jgi:hypothetical protein